MENKIKNTNTQKIVKEKIENLLNERTFSGRMLPNNEVRIIGEIIVKNVIINLPINSFEIKRVRQGNVILISAIDENEKVIVNILLTIKDFEEENKIKFKVIQTLVDILN